MTSRSGPGKKNAGRSRAYWKKERKRLAELGGRGLSPRELERILRRRT